MEIEINKMEKRKGAEREIKIADEGYYELDGEYKYTSFRDITDRVGVVEEDYVKEYNNKGVGFNFSVVGSTSKPSDWRTTTPSNTLSIKSEIQTGKASSLPSNFIHALPLSIFTIPAPVKTFSSLTDLIPSSSASFLGKVVKLAPVSTKALTTSECFLSKSDISISTHECPIIYNDSKEYINVSELSDFIPGATSKEKEYTSFTDVTDKVDLIEEEDESISLVVMPEIFEEDFVSFKLEDEDKTSDMNSFEMTQVIPKVFEVLNRSFITSDYLSYLLINSNGKVFVLPFKFVKNSSELIRNIKTKSHFNPINLSNSSIVISKCGPFSISFNSLTNSSFKGNSSTGCQSIFSQNSESSSVTPPVCLYLSNISCLINLINAFPSNLEPILVLNSSGNEIFSSAILLINKEDISYLNVSEQKVSDFVGGATSKEEEYLDFVDITEKVEVVGEENEKREEEENKSISFIVMSEENENDSLILFVDSEFKNKTLHNVDTSFSSEGVLQGFVVMGVEDDFVDFVFKNFSEDRIFPTGFFNLFFTNRGEAWNITHFIFSKNSSTELYSMGSSLNATFNSSTCSFLGGNSSTGCQSIFSQNSQSSSLNSPVCLYLSNISCLINLISTLPSNLEPILVLNSSGNKIFSSAILLINKEDMSYLNVSEIEYTLVSDFVGGATSKEKEYTSFIDISEKVEVVTEEEVDIGANNQFEIDRNRKGHVAQRIEPLSHSGEDVSSKLSRRKSHHAHEYPKEKEQDNIINNIIKEKQACSLDKESLSLRGISHEFKSVAESNQDPQHVIHNSNNYINISVTGNRVDITEKVEVVGEENQSSFLFLRSDQSKESLTPNSLNFVSILNSSTNTPPSNISVIGGEPMIPSHFNIIDNTANAINPHAIIPNILSSVSLFIYLPLEFINSPTITPETMAINKLNAISNFNNRLSTAVTNTTTQAPPKIVLNSFDNINMNYLNNYIKVLINNFIDIADNVEVVGEEDDIKENSINDVINNKNSDLTNNINVNEKLISNELGGIIEVINGEGEEDEEDGKKTQNLWPNDFRYLTSLEVENTLIPYFSNIFNPSSLDQRPILYPLFLNDKHRATNGISLICLGNISSAFDENSLKKSLLAIFTNKGKEENIMSKSSGDTLNLEQISYLCFLTSSNISFGENSFKPYFSSGSKISSFGVESFLKKENMTLVSTTNSILIYLIKPYFLATASFTSLPSLKQSSSDNVLFSVILLNTKNNSFLNAFDLSNFSSANFSSIASKTNLDLSSGRDSISFSNSSGTGIVIVPILLDDEKIYLNVSELSDFIAGATSKEKEYASFIDITDKAEVVGEDYVKEYNNKGVGFNFSVVGSTSKPSDWRTTTPSNTLSIKSEIQTGKASSLPSNFIHALPLSIFTIPAPVKTFSSVTDLIPSSPASFLGRVIKLAPVSTKALTTFECFLSKSDITISTHECPMIENYGKKYINVSNLGSDFKTNKIKSKVIKESDLREGFVEYKLSLIIDTILKRAFEERSNRVSRLFILNFLGGKNDN